MTMRVSRVIQRDTSVCSRSSNPLRVHIRRDLMTDKKNTLQPPQHPWSDQAHRGAEGISARSGTGATRPLRAEVSTHGTTGYVCEPVCL